MPGYTGLYSGISAASIIRDMLPNTSGSERRLLGCPRWRGRMEKVLSTCDGSHLTTGTFITESLEVTYYYPMKDNGLVARQAQTLLVVTYRQDARLKGAPPVDYSGNNTLAGYAECAVACSPYLADQPLYLSHCLCILQPLGCSHPPSPPATRVWPPIHHSLTWSHPKLRLHLPIVFPRPSSANRFCPASASMLAHAWASCRLLDQSLRPSSLTHA